MRFSRGYMRSAEFKARQLWLDFCDVAGTVLEVLEPVKAAAWAWFEQWRQKFRTPMANKAGPENLVLDFENARLRVKEL